MALPYQTSLSKLSEHDWNVLNSRHMRGCDWYVHKLGRQWQIIEAIGNFPLFHTKREAIDVADNLMLAESHYRSAKRHNLPTYD